MNTDIENINDKGELHGYQETYTYFHRKIYIRGKYKNNFAIGYLEWHGHELQTSYYIR